MTAPVPGFPPELEAAITTALEEHQEMLDQTACSLDECFCGYEPPEDAPRHWFSAHQAAVVMEVIAQHTTTEWGVRWQGGSEVDATGSASVAREFVAGGAAHGFSDAVVARVVLPWQEVKA